MSAAPLSHLRRRFAIGNTHQRFADTRPRTSNTRQRYTGSCRPLRDGYTATAWRAVSLFRARYIVRKAHAGSPSQAPSWCSTPEPPKPASEEDAGVRAGEGRRHCVSLEPHFPSSLSVSLPLPRPSLPLRRRTSLPRAPLPSVEALWAGHPACPQPLSLIHSVALLLRGGNTSTSKAGLPPLLLPLSLLLPPPLSLRLPLHPLSPWRAAGASRRLRLFPLAPAPEAAEGRASLPEQRGLPRLSLLSPLLSPSLLRNGAGFVDARGRVHAAGSVAHLLGRYVVPPRARATRGAAFCAPFFVSATAALSAPRRSRVGAPGRTPGRRLYRANAGGRESKKTSRRAETEKATIGKKVRLIAVASLFFSRLSSVSFALRCLAPLRLPVPPPPPYPLSLVSRSDAWRAKPRRARDGDIRKPVVSSIAQRHRGRSVSGAPRESQPAKGQTRPRAREGRRRRKSRRKRRGEKRARE